MGEVVAKKSLGQHWLNDRSILEAICDAGAIDKHDNVLEIGPGMGSLTEVLLQRCGHMFAVEFDPEAVAYLNKRFANTNNIQVEHGDIRTFDLRKLPHNYKIIANIPYYLTSHLVQIISESKNPPDTAVLLIQKEVAQRICAKEGDMSLLSVSSQYYWETSLDIDVPAQLFTPPPKVNSQVVVLKRRKTPPFKVDEKDFFRVVKAGFASKRKTLLNSLSAGLRVDKGEVLGILEKATIDPKKRPQELSLNNWFELYQVITSRHIFS